MYIPVCLFIHPLMGCFYPKGDYYCYEHGCTYIRLILVFSSFGYILGVWGYKIILYSYLTFEEPEQCLGQDQLLTTSEARPSWKLYSVACELQCFLAWLMERGIVPDFCELWALLSLILPNSSLLHLQQFPYLYVLLCILTKILSKDYVQIFGVHYLFSTLFFGNLFCGFQLTWSPQTLRVLTSGSHQVLSGLSLHSLPPGALLISLGIIGPI